MSACKDAACREEQMHRIYEYLDGALSPQDIAEIRAHLEECPTCAREYDLEKLIRSSVRRSCTEAAPVQLKQSILAKIDAVRQDSSTAGHAH